MYNVSGYEFSFSFDELYLNGSVCNNIGAKYTVLNDSILSFQESFATEIACENSIVTATEQFLLNNLHKVTNYKRTEEGLELIVDQANKFFFVETEFESKNKKDDSLNSDTVTASKTTLYVNSYQVDCEGVAPQKCLLVRNSKEEE